MDIPNITNNPKKKKAKDIIIIDSIQDHSVSNVNTIDKKTNQITNDQTSENTTEAKNKTKKLIQDTKLSNKIIKDIIFEIQLFLSYTRKIDQKLLDFLIILITQSNLKMILEERDANKKCGNILCDNPSISKGTDSYEYDSKSKKFMKNELCSLFCNVRCLQKFKEFNKLCEKFNYIILTKKKTFYKLYVLKDYFPNSPHFETISKLSCKFLECNKIPIDSEKLSKVRTILNKTFIEDIDQFFKFEDLALNPKDEVHDISIIFEKNIIIDNN